MAVDYKSFFVFFFFLCWCFYEDLCPGEDESKVARKFYITHAALSIFLLSSTVPDPLQVTCVFTPITYLRHQSVRSQWTRAAWFKATSPAPALSRCKVINCPANNGL